MPVVEALEEAIGRGAESLPDGLGLVPAHGPDRLPLGLQALDLGGRAFPLGGRRQGFGALAQGFLAREVVGPGLLARGEVFAAAREELIAGRAEAVREIDTALRLPNLTNPTQARRVLAALK